MAYSPTRHLTALNCVYDSFEEDFSSFKNYLNSGDENKELTIYDEAKIIEAITKDTPDSQALINFLEKDVFHKKLLEEHDHDEMAQIVGKVTFKLYFEPPLTLVQNMIRETSRIIHSIPKSKFNGYKFVTTLNQSLSKIFRQELIKCLKQCYTADSTKEFVKRYLSQPYLRSDWSKVEDLELTFKDSSAYAELANLVSDLRTGVIHEEVTKFLIAPFAYCTVFALDEGSSHLMPIRPIPVILIPYVTRKVAKTKKGTHISFKDSDESATKNASLHAFITSVKQSVPIFFEWNSVEDGAMLQGLKTSVNTPESYHSDDFDGKSIYSQATAKKMKDHQINSEDTASQEFQDSQHESDDIHPSLSLAQVEGSLEQFSEFKDFLEIIDKINVIIVNSYVRTETDTSIYVKDALKENLLCGTIKNDWNSVPILESNYTIGDVVNEDLVIDSISDTDIPLDVPFGFNKLKYIIFRDSRTLTLYLIELHKTDWHF